MPGKWSPRPSERWNSICAGNGRNGSLPTSPRLRSTSHTCRTSWGRTSVGPLGDSRFRTLRQHCLVYESLRKRGFTVIPWQERHVRSLLNQLAEEEVTPCKLRQVWNTLKWFSKTFGLLKIDELHRLKSKKSSLEEALTDTVTRPQRKAVVPSKEVIWVPPAPVRRRQTRGTGRLHPGFRPVPGWVQRSFQ